MPSEISPTFPEATLAFLPRPYVIFVMFRCSLSERVSARRFCPNRGEGVVREFTAKTQHITAHLKSRLTRSLLDPVQVPEDETKVPRSFQGFWMCFSEEALYAQSEFLKEERGFGEPASLIP